MLARTLLFVPANRDNMVARAGQTPADVITVDLEDSVPASEKESSRATLRASIAALKAAGKTVHVRINSLETGLTKDDLAAAITPGLDGISFPKAEAASDIREVDVLIRQQEMHNGVRPGTVLLFPQIESATAVLRCEEIARASTRIAGLSMGGEDYTADLGVPRTYDGVELEYIRRVVVHVCIAHKILPLDGIWPILGDIEGLKKEAQYARSIGFKGKYLIHPEQAIPVNAAFSPTQEELAAAHRIVEAFDEAVKQGHASVRVDGKMVDVPVAKRAQALIDLAASLPSA
jgi:citrate lyase subunit beta / citryl-CoA lyase